MSATSKIPELVDPQAMYTTNGQEAWRVLGIMAEFAVATERLRGMRPAVSLFGSARIAPEHPYYKKTEKVARLLSDAGFSVISGGGPGLMEAANRGAYGGRSPSIGLNIVLPHEKGGNEFQDVSFDFRYFFARKMMFVRLASAYVVMPGGFGTLDELSECLTLVQTGKARKIPIILVGGDFWRGLIDWMRGKARRRGHDRRRRHRPDADHRGAGGDRRGDLQVLREPRIPADARGARQDAQSLKPRARRATSRPPPARTPRGVRCRIVEGAAAERAGALC